VDLTGWVAEGPLTCVGGRTQWDVGGSVGAGATHVRAPAGVVDYEPAEMVVRVGAGTTFHAIDATLAEAGQMVPLDPPIGDAGAATVGGLLAVGRSGSRRLRYGPIRDTLLEARIAMANGTVIKAGGPVVKNVTGYDLARLFVGSLGTIGFLVEAVLRCQPRPRRAVWLHRVGADPFAARQRLFRPSSVLWDGTATWVLLEGRDEDVRAERATLGDGWDEVDAPPVLPRGGQRSLRPSALRGLAATATGFVAEVGVGIVHTDEPVAVTAPDPSTIDLHRRIKSTFDPEGRMNPGRRLWS
jgi:FAD/FMN-containing dehydrogenase